MSTEQPLKIAIIGAGISGIAQAIRLKHDLGKKASVTLYERQSSPGGIWRDSIWPDAGVDTPIHIYELYSDLNPSWTSCYAKQPEVLAYLDRLIDKHNLRSNIVLNTEYVRSTWVEEQQAHIVQLETTDPNSQKHRLEITADVLISATGPLARPRIPDIPGLSSYRGQYFHNLKWDSSVKLEGKRIAVLGSGSSGVQLVPGIANLPGVRLTHFIRSGGYFIPKVNWDFTPFQRWVFRWVPGAQRLYRAKVFFEYLARRLAKWRGGRAGNHVPGTRTEQEEKLLKYLKEVAPSEYLEALTPNYPLGCKRVARDEGWLKSLHRENVELISDKIVQITESGLHTANGRFFLADIIIFATGSEVARYGLGISDGLKGQDELDLGAFYDSIGGPEAYMGISIPQFPNYFVVLGPNSTAGSWGYTLGVSTNLISRVIKEFVGLGLSSIQPTATAFEEHNAKLRKGLEKYAPVLTACTNYGRLGNKITSGNIVTSIGLWRQTRTTKWADWTGTKRIKASGELQTVNICRLVQKRRAVKVAVLGLSFVTVGIAFYFGRSIRPATT